LDLDLELIKSFVKDDLGCKCPDEVFNQIKFQKNVKISIDLEVDRIINIGDKLLIFLFYNKDMEYAKKNLETIIDCGKSWRDDEELNRFRLVFISNTPKKLKQKISSKFEKFIGKDKKIHLHIINKKNFKEKKFFVSE
jgi:hypothetical protein